MSKPIASFNGSAIKDGLRELVRHTAENALMGFQEEKADGLVDAKRHERTVDVSMILALLILAMLCITHLGIS